MQMEELVRELRDITKDVFVCQCRLGAVADKLSDVFGKQEREAQERETFGRNVNQMMGVILKRLDKVEADAEAGTGHLPTVRDQRYNLGRCSGQTQGTGGTSDKDERCPSESDRQPG